MAERRRGSRRSQYVKRSIPQPNLDMTEKLLREQNKTLKGLVSIMVEMLPKHSRDCYGMRVHPSNTEEYCDCVMDEIRKKVRDLI
ncbi:hypothetical protein KAR91_20380 [Candidatus Pacearchaeota archaeon]|nr:hypothetical protein [Candidatus Pacearchaeota archaeon]